MLNFVTELAKVLPVVAYIFEIMASWERPIQNSPTDECTNAAETLSLQFHTEITNFFLKMPYVCIVDVRNCAYLAVEHTGHVHSVQSLVGS